MEMLKQAIVRYAEVHVGEDGVALTPLPGVRMMCVHRPRGPMHSIYKPLVCLVLQGAKQMTVGVETATFRAGQSVVVTLDAPVAGRIVEASPEAPYLALAVELDMAALQDLAAELAPTPAPGDRIAPALFAEDTEAATLDCAMRLMRLLDHPEAAPALQPGIVRELHYWLLAGRHGAAIRALAHPDSGARRIAAAIRILRQDYPTSLPVERLAEAAGMSTSVFHRRFKAMTSLTPVQFQKQLRLVEARRLMRAEGVTASRAAFEVGYESASHFTRDYRRMYGAPPRRDTAQAASR